MGKYIKKSKTTGELALMEVSQHQSSLGVRTRAKTLALKKLTAVTPSTVGSVGSYLQLRSRRLEKPPVSELKRHKQVPKPSSVTNPSPSPNSSSRLRAGSGNSVSVGGSESLERDKVVNEREEEIHATEKNASVEASFGENVLDFEGRERSTRETTPCSLVRDPETVRTPGSTTRPSSSAVANERVQYSVLRNIPSTNEMDELFSGAEAEQQKQFIEKYNFDPVNEKPLPGRYEWVKVDP